MGNTEGLGKVYFFLTHCWWVWGHPQQWSAKGGRKQQKGGTGAVPHQRAFLACFSATASIRALWLHSRPPALLWEAGMSSSHSDPSSRLPGVCSSLPGCAGDFWAQRVPLMVNLWRIWSLRIIDGAYCKCILVKLEILLFCGKCLQISDQTVWRVL